MDLLPGERIVWAGESTTHRLLRPPDALLIPFSLVWGGFAIFWEVQAVSLGAPGFFALWGVPFVLVGLYLIVGRFVIRAISLRNARYTVTDRRVVITGGLTGASQYTQYLRSLPPPVMRERSDGSGDLAFGSLPSIFDGVARRRGNMAMWGEPLSPPVFRGVDNIRHVRDLVVAAQAAARP